MNEVSPLRRGGERDWFPMDRFRGDTFHVSSGLVRIPTELTSSRSRKVASWLRIVRIVLCMSTLCVSRHPKVLTV